LRGQDLLKALPLKSGYKGMAGVRNHRYLLRDFANI
jgi:hypothetical protein